MNMITMMKITKMTMRIRRRMFSEDAQLQSYAVCGQRMAEPQNGKHKVTRFRPTNMWYTFSVLQNMSYIVGSCHTLNVSQHIEG